LKISPPRSHRTAHIIKDRLDGGFLFLINKSFIFEKQEILKTNLKISVDVYF